MKIIARERDSYRISCHDGHVFTAARPSISVECPVCGRTESTSRLIDRLIDGVGGTGRADLAS